MKKNIFLTAIFAVVLTGAASAQPLSQIQIAVATPDPVKAGEPVTFQIIVVNNEQATWTAADVKCYVEVFDTNGKYIQKTQSASPAADVAPGGSSLFLIKYRIPEFYSGRYQYRVLVDRRGQNILTSDLYEFNVRASAAPQKKEKPYFMSGNVAASYKNAPRSNYQTTMSANMLGKLAGKTMIFNSNAYSTTDKRFDLDNIFLSLFADKYKLSVGDVMPDYSPLSVYSLTGRGANLNYDLGRIDLSGCYIRTQKASEGNSSSNGTYARYTAATSAGVNLPANFKLHMTGAVTSDDKNSISSPGPSNEALSGEVMSAQLNWTGSVLKVKGEYAAASNKKDTYDSTSGKYQTATSTSSKAFMLKTGLYGKIFDVTAKYRKVEPGFLNIANPGIYDDRKTEEAYINFYPVSLVRLNAGYQSSNDNLNNDPDAVTTNQKITQYGVQLAPHNLPALSFSSSLNSVKGSSVTILDNDTKGFSYGASYYVFGQMLSVNFSLSQFRNHTSTDTGQNIDTSGMSVSYSGKITKNISLDLGYTLSDSKNLYTRSSDKVMSASAGTNVKIIKKINIFLYGANTKRESPDASDPSKKDVVSTVDTSLEITYRMKSNLSLTFGGSYEKQDETATAPENYTSSGGILRLNYTF